MKKVELKNERIRIQIQKKRKLKEEKEWVGPRKDK